MDERYSVHVSKEEKPNRAKSPRPAAYTQLTLASRNATSQYTTVKPIGQQCNTVADNKKNTTGAEDENKCSKIDFYHTAILFLTVAMVLILIVLVSFSVLAYTEIIKIRFQDESLKVKELNHSVNIVNCNSSVNETLMDSIIGLTEGFPASSCSNIHLLHRSSRSGYYWVKSINGSSVQVYCAATVPCGNSPALVGWMRVAKLNKCSCGAECFSGLKQLLTNESSCVAKVDEATMSQTFFSPFNFTYSRVCGIIQVYGVGTPDGFIAATQNIDENYVDGISITYGRQPNRQHIYTYSAAEQCSSDKIPDFVSQDYSCSVTQSWEYTSCSQPNCVQYFYKELGETTDQDIEMRVCRDQPRSDEDIIIEMFEIYVQ